MKRPKDKDLPFRDRPDYVECGRREAERERQRLEAMRKGEYAEYGYFKQKRKTKPLPQLLPDPPDVPLMEYIKMYKLDCTRDQANEAISNNESPIGIILCGESGLFWKTPLNALKLPSLTVIPDINYQSCLYWKNWFYKWI